MHFEAASEDHGRVTHNQGGQVTCQSQSSASVPCLPASWRVFYKHNQSFVLIKIYVVVLKPQSKLLLRQRWNPSSGQLELADPCGEKGSIVENVHHDCTVVSVSLGASGRHVTSQSFSFKVSSQSSSSSLSRAFSRSVRSHKLCRPAAQALIVFKAIFNFYDFARIEFKEKSRSHLRNTR
jgi:hypothetical protein